MKRIEIIEKNIEKLKEEMRGLFPFRPGKLRRVSKTQGNSKSTFWQLKYTHKNVIKTDYIRPEFVKQLRIETSNYKHYRRKHERLIALSIKLSKAKIPKIKKQKGGTKS